MVFGSVTLRANNKKGSVMWDKSIKFAGGITCALLAFTQASLAEGKAETFEQFLEGLKKEASEKGLPENILETSLEGLSAPLPGVMKRLETQPESTFSFKKYFGSMVSDHRVSKGQKNYLANRDELLEKSAKYGIPAETIVAMWGVETAYGNYTGGYDIVPSLASLAYASHRKTFFRKELFDALKIVAEGHKPAADMTGSWAGAMGQCQFMPSSFLMYARDGNGDGKKDIWSTLPDVFASAANYLKSHGWKKDQKWGERVTLTQYLPGDLELSKRGVSQWLTTEEWKEMGIAPKAGMLPKGTKARLFLPEGPSGRAWLTYHNFSVIMRWNNSSYFAVSALSLSDEIAKAEKGV